MLTVSLLTLGDPGQLTGGYLYHRRLAEAAPAYDARVRFVSLPQAAFPLPAVSAPLVLRQAFRGSDVLLVDSIAAAYVGPALAVRRPSLPVAAIAHQPPGGIDHGPARTRVQAVLDELAYRRVAVVLAASAALAEQFPAWLRGRTVVVPPGRDTPEPAAAGAGDLRSGRRSALLYVGNWVERKGLLDLLDAVGTLPYDAATLHLVGSTTVDCAYAERVHARLGQPDVAGRVVVHGPVDRATVTALYRGADVFVLPSRREPYGTAYGEAMAAGLPVVGWRAGNLPHLADDGREGLLVEPGDVSGLAAALRRLTEDEPYRRRLGDAARRRATATLPTWDETARRTFGVLRDLAG